VAQLEGATATDDWLVRSGETLGVEVDTTKSVIVDISGRTDRTESSLGNDDIVSGAES